MGTTFGPVTFFIGLLILLVAILWILLPFLVMGTNKRLDRQIKNQEDSMKILEAIKWDLEKNRERTTASPK